MSLRIAHRDECYLRFIKELHENQYYVRLVVPADIFDAAKDFLGIVSGNRLPCSETTGVLHVTEKDPDKPLTYYLNARNGCLNLAMPSLYHQELRCPTTST